MNRSGANAERLGRFEDSCAGRQCSRMRLTTASFTGRRPSRFPWLRARERPALTRSINNGALELRKDAKHLKHRLPGWRAGVEALLDGCRAHRSGRLAFENAVNRRPAYTESPNNIHRRNPSPEPQRRVPVLWAFVLCKP
jgi:hypothetical protein